MMMMKYILVFSFIFFSLFVLTIYPQQKITAKEEENHIGENLIVTGIVCQVYHSRTDTYFLEINGNYLDNEFTAVIFKSDSKKFKNLMDIEGQEVKVNGVIKEYNCKTEIMLKTEN
jgi:DNA/RNA endonuclease YhcR with UshA esterase domain